MSRDSNKFPSQDSDVSQDSKIGADIAQFSAGWTTWNRAGLQESCCKRCKFVRYARSRVRPIADRQISFREQREDIDASLIYPRYSYFSLSLSLLLFPSLLPGLYLPLWIPSIDDFHGKSVFRYLT